MHCFIIELRDKEKSPFNEARQVRIVADLPLFFTYKNNLNRHLASFSISFYGEITRFHHRNAEAAKKSVEVASAGREKGEGEEEEEEQEEEQEEEEKEEEQHPSKVESGYAAGDDDDDGSREKIVCSYTHTKTSFSHISGNNILERERTTHEFERWKELRCVMG